MDIVRQSFYNAQIGALGRLNRINTHHDEAMNFDFLKLQRQFTDLWWESETSMPDIGPTYLLEEQENREACLLNFQNALNSEIESPPQSESACKAAQEHILSSFRVFAQTALDFDDSQMEVLLTRGFTEAAGDFVRVARSFDPLLSDEDISQAIRNAVTMNSLQLLLGRSVQLTPALFGYSMLYPYTDNYLDDPGIPAEVKMDFNKRFGQRLAGEDIAPANTQELTIFNLVNIIEYQYSRVRYPQVYDSLLAIHRAQTESLKLLHPNLSPYEVDVLGISIAKGGSSVLADGTLVSGSLTKSQAEFFYGYGAFLQIEDDLQDVRQDLRDGILTVFSQTAERWPLDAITNRTFHFGGDVLKLLQTFDTPGLVPFKELMRRSATLLLLEAAGRAEQFYSSDYLQKLETHSPFRFSSLRNSLKKAVHQSEMVVRFAQAFSQPVEKGFSEGTGKGVEEIVRSITESTRVPKWV